MNTNVGNMDRILRLVIGIALIAAALFSGFAIFDGTLVKYGAVVIGLVLAATGLLQKCPMYSIVGVRTCKV